MERAFNTNKEIEPVYKFWLLNPHWYLYLDKDKEIVSDYGTALPLLVNVEPDKFEDYIDKTDERTFDLYKKIRSLVVFALKDGSLKSSSSPNSGRFEIKPEDLIRWAVSIGLTVAKPFHVLLKPTEKTEWVTIIKESEDSASLILAEGAEWIEGKDLSALLDSNGKEPYDLVRYVCNGLRIYFGNPNEPRSFLSTLNWALKGFIQGEGDKYKWIEPPTGNIDEYMQAIKKILANDRILFEDIDSTLEEAHKLNLSTILLANTYIRQEVESYIKVDNQLISTSSESGNIPVLERQIVSKVRSIGGGPQAEASSSSPEYLDPNHPGYAPELAIAVNAWVEIHSTGYLKGNKGHKDQIKTFLKKKYPDVAKSNEALERISTVINSKARKSGGCLPTEVEE